MSEPVSRHDVTHMHHEYDKTVKTLLAFIFDKIMDSKYRVDSQVLIKVDKETVYKGKLGQEATENKLTPAVIKQLQTALEQSHLLRGSVSIYIGKEKIFHVKDGVVLKDSLQLVPQLLQIQLESSPKEQAGSTLNQVVNKGKELVVMAVKLLARLGTQHADSSTSYKGEFYDFVHRGELLSVTSKDGRVVMDNNGFTSQANEKDMEILRKLEQIRHLPSQPLAKVTPDKLSPAIPSPKTRVSL